jgi:hypothetical protein
MDDGDRVNTSIWEQENRLFERVTVRDIVLHHCVCLVASFCWMYSSP